MLRAPHWSCSSHFVMSGRRLPILSGLSFSFLSPKPSASSLLRPPNKTLHKSFGTLYPFPCFGRARSMGCSPKPQCKALSTAWKSGGGNKEILVQHLLVAEKDLKLLTELQQRIARGEDLSDLAVEFSICPSKEYGGMLGWVRKGQLEEPEPKESGGLGILDLGQLNYARRIKLARKSFVSKVFS